MLDDIPFKTCGIYIFTCIPSGKVYIGQSKDIRHRRNCHLSRLGRGEHSSPHFQKAYNLYGRKAFSHQILELCSVDALTEKEQFWLDLYDKGVLMNAMTVAQSTKEYVYTDEVKAKMKRINGSPERRALVSARMRGRVFSEVTRQRISEAKKLAASLFSIDTSRLRRVYGES